MPFSATPPVVFLGPPESDALAAPEYELYLYLNGNSPRSINTRRALETICQQHLAGRYTLTVIDLHEHPERAAEDEILGIPCLVKRRPGLVRRLVGDLADQNKVLKALGLI